MAVLEMKKKNDDDVTANTASAVARQAGNKVLELTGSVTQ